MEGKEDHTDDQQEVHEEVRNAVSNKSNNPENQQKRCNSQQHGMSLPIPGRVLFFGIHHCPAGFNRMRSSLLEKCSILYRPPNAAFANIAVTMSNAYQFVFACPKGGHNISLPRKCSNPSLSEVEAMGLVGNEFIACEHAKCGWSGKAAKAKLLRILPFDWIFSPVKSRRSSDKYDRSRKLSADPIHSGPQSLKSDYR